MRALKIENIDNACIIDDDSILSVGFSPHFLKRFMQRVNVSNIDSKFLVNLIAVTKVLPDGMRSELVAEKYKNRNTVYMYNKHRGLLFVAEKTETVLNFVTVYDSETSKWFNNVKGKSWSWNNFKDVFGKLKTTESLYKEEEAKSKKIDKAREKQNSKKVKSWVDFFEKHKNIIKLDYSPFDWYETQGE